MKSFFTHCVKLPSSHTLAQPELPLEQIEKFYSVCGRPHGHSYRLEITHDLSHIQQGQAQALFLKLKAQIDDFMETTYAGKDLNELFGNTAGEALSPQFFKILKQKEFGKHVCQIAIQETAKNRFVTTVDNLRTIN